jgi:hypothetical protein
MKTQKWLLKIMGALTLALVVVGCADKRDTQNSQQSQIQYAMVGGMCYNITNNIQVAPNYCYGSNGMTSNFNWNGSQCWDYTQNRAVDPSFCSNIGNNNGTDQYFYQNGLCYSVTTRMPVDYTRCSGNTGGTLGGTSMQCIGVYIIYGSYGPQPISCNGTNCRGQTVMDSSGRQITCL